MTQTGRSDGASGRVLIGLAFLLGACCIHCSGATAGLATAPSRLLAAALALAFVGRFKLVAARLLAGLGWAWLSAAGRTRRAICRRRWRGRICSCAVTSHRSRAQQPEIRNSCSTSREPRDGVSPRIRLVCRQCNVAAARAPQAGELWQLVVRLKRRNGFANPGGFDHEAHLFREGIGATGYVRDDARNARLAPPTLRYAVTARARLDLRAHSRGGARSARARRSAGSRGRRHAGDDAGAMARVRCDRHDAPDGDLGPAYQHGRSAGRVARRRDRAAAVCAGTPLERDARPGDRRYDGGIPVLDARWAVGAHATHADHARASISRRAGIGVSSRSRMRWGWRSSACC